LLYLDPVPHLTGADEHVYSLSVIAQLSFDIVRNLVRGILDVGFVVQVLDAALLLSYDLFDRLGRLAVNAT
jgi:hypothetical protein